MVEAKQNYKGSELVSEVLELVLKWGSNAFRHVCDYTTKLSEIYVQQLAMGIVTKISVGPWPLRASANLFQSAGSFEPL